MPYDALAKIVGRTDKNSLRAGIRLPRCRSQMPNRMWKDLFSSAKWSGFSPGFLV